MKNKFDSLNNEFNIEDDIAHTEVVKSKIEDIKKTSNDIKRIMIIHEEISIV